jgi:hypothetical protein
VLSDIAPVPSASSQRPPARPAIVANAPASETRSETRRPEPSSAARPNFVSPFAADSARKGTPRQESAVDSTHAGPRIVPAAAASEPIIMGSVAPQRPPVSAAEPQGANEGAYESATAPVAEAHSQGPAPVSPPTIRAASHENKNAAGEIASGRGRAEQDPVVRRMREKFGAEIRTVIDYKEKR